MTEYKNIEKKIKDILKKESQNTEYDSRDELKDVEKEYDLLIEEINSLNFSSIDEQLLKKELILSVEKLKEYSLEFNDSILDHSNATIRLGYIEGEEKEDAEEYCSEMHDVKVDKSYYLNNQIGSVKGDLEELSKSINKNTVKPKSNSRKPQ
jgi:hypothetical protein